MKIQGIQKVTLLDFPGKVSCTVFTSGCNFRCPFCQNASLVVPGMMQEQGVDEEDFFAFLATRVKKLDGVCISGGEPTLQPDLKPFIRRIRAMGFEVKLDTNGSDPEILHEMIDEGLLDYVAMDIKNTRNNYAVSAGISEPPLDKLDESMKLLLTGRVPFEFRTTIVDELHTEEDIEAIAIQIKGAPRYFLQMFSDEGDLIQTGLHACSRTKMQLLQSKAAEYVPNASIRGG
jgi:pyruvate formate lyase activating enzyme